MFKYKKLEKLEKQVWKFMDITHVKISVIYACVKYLIKHPYVNLVLWKVKINQEFPKLRVQTYEATKSSIVTENHLLSKWHLMFL